MGKSKSRCTSSSPAAGDKSSFDIWAEEIPDDASISELCDCGHHKRRKYGNLKNILAQPKKVALLETNYSSDYRAIENPRPRSSKRPLAPPQLLYPPPMMFETVQRENFKSYNEVERVKPMFQEKHHESPAVPLQSMTSYRHQYRPKLLLPAVQQKSAAPDDDRKSGCWGERKPLAKFEDKTTTGEHYKRWPHPPLTIPFGELPSFTGSILFPAREPLPQSTTHQAFPMKSGPRTLPIKLGGGTIKPEGSMDLMTTHRDAYKQFEGDHRVQKMEHKPEITMAKRGKFMSETQFQRDFPGFQGRQPSPARPTNPPKATVTLSYDNKCLFDTEQRTTYRGHDINEHPMRQLCKKDSKEYVPPSIKLETMTSHKRDFRPIPPGESCPPQATCPAQKLCTHSDVRFDDRTMNREFFKDWGIRPPFRYGDLHEAGMYVPPLEKFTMETTTQTAYTPKKIEMVKSFKPAPQRVTPTGGQDLVTSYRKTYKKPKVKMCPAQIFLIQQELKKNQAAEDHPSNEGIVNA